ncbi:type VI secretion system baseplate subunit TssG [Jannaschia sp. CCS1]|uniref:type VI secretion system baseplate subunit TssG n=1 Tax=Jannaschia sp. (strain CCS1) TaxID=290400 RepID=UPI000053A5E6|nr:type VI secretion system baseplate subunit TssG [Jannaschia sp. CCS1]ABD55948.1 protein of unknown function DUF1305 [Jannaschia sp. CCS1]
MSTLFDQLEAAPDRFDPLTALRLAQAEAARRDLPLDIRSVPTGALAPTAIARVTADDTAIRVEAAFAGLTGPLSPLPPAWTELAAVDRRRRAGGLSAFLDLFSGRLTDFFARAAAKYDLPVLLQWTPPAANRMLTALRALVGTATPGLPTRAPLATDSEAVGDALLSHAGLLAQRTRTATGLRAMACSQLGLPVEVIQFHRRWRPVPVSEQTRLDGSRALGRDASAGAWLPDCAGQIRLVVGPVRYADFLSLELGEPRLRDFARLMRFTLGPVLEFDIQIVLDHRDIPQTQLGGDGPPARLGWNGWASSGPATRDSDEAVIDGRRAAA